MRYATVFAGINGTAAVRHHPESEASTSASPAVRVVESSSSGQTLFDPSGHWAIQLRSIPLDQARCLLQILRDLSPVGTQIDGPFLRRVSAYDEAAAASKTLAEEILRDLAALDTLSYRMARAKYTEITERSLRRSILSQLSDRPLMERLGVRNTAYAL